jgi:hypothetical protein
VATCCGFMARVLLAQGKIDEAKAMFEEAERIQSRTKK